MNEHFECYSYDITQKKLVTKCCDMASEKEKMQFAMVHHNFQCLDSTLIVLRTLINLAQTTDLKTKQNKINITRKQSISHQTFVTSD